MRTIVVVINAILMGFVVVKAKFVDDSPGGNREDC